MPDVSIGGAEAKLSELAGQIAGRSHDPEMEQIKTDEQKLEKKAASLPETIDKGLSKDYPERPAPPKPPKITPFQPPVQRGAIDTFGNFATALGALGGLLTRHPLTASLNAASAAMKALKDNDVASYEQAWTQYKQQQDYAFKMADYEMNRYKAYIDDKSLMTQEILGGLRTEATLLQNRSMLHATETGDLSLAAGLYEKMADLNLRAQEAANKINPVMAALKSEIVEANKSGHPMTHDQIAKRMGELNQMADPKLQEVIRHNKQMEKVRGLINEKKQKDAIDNIGVARDEIADLIKEAGKPDARVTGLSGYASRAYETAKTLVAPGETPASDFQSKLETLQLTLPKLLTGTSRSSADERAKVSTIARGLSPGDTAQKTINALQQLDGILAERAERIKSGQEDMGGGLEGLTDEEIKEQLRKAFGGD